MLRAAAPALLLFGLGDLVLRLGDLFLSLADLFLGLPDLLLGLSDVVLLGVRCRERLSAAGAGGAGPRHAVAVELIRSWDLGRAGREQGQKSGGDGGWEGDAGGRRLC